MNQKTEMVMVLPGVTGWEIWAGLPGAPLELRTTSEQANAGGIVDLPAGDVMHVFRVRDATVMPFKTNTADESLFEDVAQMHCERMGVKADPFAGQLLDFFVTEKTEESAAITAVVLRAPEEGQLPPRSPKFFDYSPRVYPFVGNGVALWKELGHWVFAFYRSGQMLYAQSTANDEALPDANLARDIWLAMKQLGFQGISVVIDSVMVWHPDGEQGDASALAGVFEVPVQVAARPDPVVPSTECRLLPADVFAERRAAQKRKQVITALGSIAAVLVLFLLWAGWGVLAEMRETNQLKAQALAMQPERDAYSRHKSKWRELAPLVEEDQWPVETLYRITKCMPMPKGVIRLREANIGNNEIRIKGEANQSPPIGQFSYAINKSAELSRFKFTAPPPSNTAKGWTFEIQGAVPQDQP
ncbi:MAG: hypothetical protein EAZ81_03935 [Verrucomicrobia bacterium]|nr:MAG: hypothetical protein EAZ81_03935 [Verrucomicrobiota bacterium]